MPENRKYQAGVRCADGRWRAGASGNPGGRPVVISNIRDLARQHTAEAVDALVRNLTCGNPSAEIAAASELLNRGYGRAPQNLDVGISFFDTLTLEEREMLDVACSALIEARANAIPPAVRG